MRNASWNAADGVARLLCPAPHVIHLAESRVPSAASGGDVGGACSLAASRYVFVHQKMGHNFGKKRKYMHQNLFPHDNSQKFISG